MSSSHGRRIATFACAIAALMSFGIAGAAPAGADDGDTVEAVWKPQRINFEYRGYSTLYTCRSLQNKLEKILMNVGARDGVELRTYQCDDQAGIARFQVALTSPVEATAENVRELTTYDSNDELVARVRGERLAAAEDVERFPAVWKQVSFARDRKMRLAPGDCELVQQLRRQILPRMSVRIVRDDVRCSSAFGNITPPRLTVSALVPATVEARVTD